MTRKHGWGRRLRLIVLVTGGCPPSPFWPLPPMSSVSPIPSAGWRHRPARPWCSRIATAKSCAPLPLASGGRAEWIAIDQMPPELIDATLAGEDRRFFDHNGVDIFGVGRRQPCSPFAHGHVVSGASTHDHAVGSPGRATRQGFCPTRSAKC